MKKSLSFLVALALVFGLFASMAAAADTDLTTAQKYQQLVDNKVLKGTTDGDPHLTSNLTRAEFATIAVAIAGLQEDTASASAFKDVKAGQWWTGAIQAAYNAGLVNGVGNNLFSPKANVTVQEIIKVAVGIAGLTPVADAKVDGAADWAGPYIKAAQDAGLPVPTNYTAAATRGQTIDLAYAVYLSKQVKPLDEVKATVNADDTITVTGKTAGGIDSVKVAIGTADAVAATLNADGTFTYTTAKQAVGSYDLTVTAYKGDTSVSSAKVSATIDGFTVKTATVVNAKQIALQFNKAVLDGTATGGAKNLGYYSLAGANPTAVDVSDDKTTVTLTFSGGFALENYAQLSVSTVKSSSGQDVSAYKQAIYLTDKTAPTVSSVTYSGGIAKVTFSEPLQSVGTVSINGNQINSTANSSTPYYTVATNDAAHGSDITSMTITNLSSGTAYSLNIVGGYDTASDFAPATTVPNYFDYSTSLNVSADTTPPTVTSLTSNGGVITVKYSEGIKATNLGALYDANTGVKIADGKYTDGTGSDATSVDYDASAKLGSNSFVTLSVTVRDFADQNYPTVNTGSPYTTSVTLSTDTTKATVSSVFYTSNKEVVLNFSETIGTVGTLTYDYTDTNGVVYKGKTLANAGVIGYDADNDGTVESTEKNYVTYSTSGLAAGTYVFHTTGFKDAAATPNTSDDASVTLTVTASSGTGIVKMTQAEQTSAGVLKLTFDHNLATIAKDPSKYLINGVALPSGTNIYFLGAQNVVVAELPAGYVTASGNRQISVQGLVDVDGNTLDTSSSAYYQAIVGMTENVKPTAGTITVVNDRTITVSFSEPMTTNNAPSGIAVYMNGSSVAATGLTYSVSGSTLTITGGSNSFSTTTPIIVKFTSSNVADAQGNTIADSQVSR